MKRYVLSLPLCLNHAQHGAGAYLSWGVRMQPGLSVRLTVVHRATQPETGSAAFCPAAHEQ